ncbi:hypothetical protein AQUCO_01100004v1 [Aquilegia coerulea]|nr:hypothetical protein AQUCO_01100004v1 [Aquilegia coerulea]
MKCTERCTCVIAKFLERFPHIEALVLDISKHGYCSTSRIHKETIFPMFHSVFTHLRSIEIQNLLGNEHELDF